MVKFGFYFGVGIMSAIIHYKNIASVMCLYSKRNGLFQAGCLLLALSRFFQVVSFFLPLKILILLASDGQSSYINFLPFRISYSVFIGSLVITVPILYMLYISTGVAHRYILDKDILLLKRSERIESEVDHKLSNRLVKSHGHVAKLTSEIILVIIAFVSISIVNISMAVFMAILAYFVIFSHSRNVFYIMDSDRVGPLKLHRRQCIEYISAISFIGVFFFLATHVYFFDAGVFKSLFSLILSRMLIQALQRFSIENIYVVTQMKLEFGQPIKFK